LAPPPAITEPLSNGGLPRPCVPFREGALTILGIAALMTSLYLAAWAVAAVLSLPPEVGVPGPVRLLGIPVFVGGLALNAWLFRYRRFRDVLASTHATLVKLLRAAPILAPVGRTEPLVVVGPYRVVRHPMYGGILLMLAGVALAVDHTWAWLGAAFVWIWFAAVLTPFEERELRALFGPAYEAYARGTPRFVPRFWRRHRQTL